MITQSVDGENNMAVKTVEDATLIKKQTRALA